MLLLLAVLAETPLVVRVPAATLPTLPELVRVFDPVPSNSTALLPRTVPPFSTVTLTVPLVPPVWIPGATNRPPLTAVVRVLVPLTVAVLVPGPAPSSCSAPAVPVPVTLPEPV